MGDVRVYDFKKSQKFSTENIRFLTLLCEEFCRTSNLQIHYELKNQNLKLNMNKTYQTTYGEFVDNTTYDCVIIEYKISPLVENLTLKIDKFSVLVMIDLILGGDGKIQDSNRELTDIDIELLEYLVSNLLKRMHIPEGCDCVEICNIYPNASQYPELKSSESIFASVVDINFDKESIGTLRFCIPYRSMEPVLGQLVSKKLINSSINNDNEEYDVFKNTAFDYMKNVEIDVLAKLGSSRINISELLKIEVGDIILLNQKINENIDVSVGNSNTYKGKAGLIGSKNGIEIIDYIDREI